MVVGSIPTGRTMICREPPCPQAGRGGFAVAGPRAMRAPQGPLGGGLSLRRPPACPIARTLLSHRSAETCAKRMNPPPVPGRSQMFGGLDQIPYRKVPNIRMGIESLGRAPSAGGESIPLHRIRNMRSDGWVRHRCHTPPCHTDDDRGPGPAHQGRTVGPSRRKGPLLCGGPFGKGALFLGNRSPRPSCIERGLANARQGPLASRPPYCAALLHATKGPGRCGREVEATPRGRPRTPRPCPVPAARGRLGWNPAGHRRAPGIAV